MSQKQQDAILRRQRFVAEYLVDYNGTGAAVRCGFVGTNDSAHTVAWRWLKDPEVQQMIADEQANLLKKVLLTPERTLRELARLSYFDIRKLYDADGKLLPIHELDDDTAAALEAIDLEEKVHPETGELITVKRKYRAASKNAAISNSLRVLGLLKDKEETPVNNFPEIDTIDAARRIAFLLAKAANEMIEG